jgi:hypothetical protein
MGDTDPEMPDLGGAVDVKTLTEIDLILEDMYDLHTCHTHKSNECP